MNKNVNQILSPRLSGKCFAARNIAVPSTRDVIPQNRNEY